MSYLDAGFGVELEVYLPEGSTMQAAAMAVSSRIGENVAVEGYNHFLRPTWKVVTDGSLGDYVRGCEFVSPVLWGEAGLAQAAAVCKALSDFGCTVSKKCGFHVHVGVGNPALQFFKNVIRLYGMYEPVIDSIMPPSRRGSSSTWCRSLTSVRPAAIEQAASLRDLAVVATPGSRSDNERRYYKVNLMAYLSGRHKTVEFRQHSGTLDGVKVCNWVRFCLRLVAKAMASDLVLGGTVAARTNLARPGTKAHAIGQMFLRPEGVTGREVMVAMNWPSVSMPAQARQAGIEFTTQRTGREVRYFARVATTTVAAPAAAPISLDGLAALVGMSDSEREFFAGRARDLRGPVAWAA